MNKKDIEKAIKEKEFQLELYKKQVLEAGFIIEAYKKLIE